MTSDSHSTASLRKLLALALLTFGQLIAEPAFVLIDTAIVGHVSENALAGLALGSTVVLTAVGLCVFLAYATTSQVARHFGAGRKVEGLQAGIDGIWLSFLIGVVLSAVLFFAAEPLCWLLGGRDADLSQAVIYVRTVLLGVPGMLIVYASNGLFRGLQKASITLVVAVAGAVVNTVLDVVFVIGLGWGIGGSGFATFIAQWFMGIALLVPAIRWARRSKVSLKPRWEGITASGKEGSLLFVRTLALRAGLVATLMAAASLGTAVLAGYQVVNASWNVMLNLLDSVAIAGQALIGAELGASRKREARDLTRLTLRAGALMGVATGLAFIGVGFFAPQLFTPSPEIQHLATIGMVISGIALPMQGWMWATDGILIGSGDFRYLAITCTLVSAVYIIVLVALVFGIAPNIQSISVRSALIWVAFDFILMGGRAITNGIRIRTDEWMKLG